MYRINLNNNNLLENDGENTILESLQNNKLNAKYSCKDGRCDTCLALLKEGAVFNLKTKALTKILDSPIPILSCVSIPKSNINLDIELVDEKYYIPEKIFPAKIDTIQFLTKNVCKLELKTPKNNKIKYHPGQYVDFIFEGKKRSYSIAYKNENLLGFYLRIYETGVFSNFLKKADSIGKVIQIEGPKGTFFLNQSTINKPFLTILCTGTGIAPIINILKSLDQNNFFKKIQVYWGNRKEEDFFISMGEIKSYCPNIDIDVHFVTSREANQYPQGYIQEKLCQKHSTLKDHHILACGSPMMIAESENLLKDKGVLPINFQKDSFLSSIQ